MVKIGGFVLNKKIKHLEMIQEIIKRMASNSFLLKGWAVTLASGIFALAEKDTNELYFLVAYVPIIVFWGLDSYYLLQERFYRALYKKVQLLSEDDVDFSLNVSKEKFGDAHNNNFLSCLFSKTEILFYFPLAIICAGIIIVTRII